MSDSPIKFSSSESSSEDDLLAHQSSEVEISSDVWRAFDYSPSWSFEKEDPEEEDEVEEEDATAAATAADSVSDSDFDSPPPRRARRA
jgi:hypothetical protein